MVIVAVLVVVIITRLRRGKFGTRLLAKLAFFFALVGVVPGGIIYIVSYQFVSRSIESWFDVNVETALTSGLNLGRGMLDASLSDLQTKGRLMAEQIANADSAGTSVDAAASARSVRRAGGDDRRAGAQHVGRIAGYARRRASDRQLRIAHSQRPAHAVDDRAGARPRLCCDRRRSGRRSASARRQRHLATAHRAAHSGCQRVAAAAERPLPAADAAGVGVARAQCRRCAARVPRIPGEGARPHGGCARCISAR